ncbi:unnamed protein product [Miscanthus lutarioriparius]|uniref:Disease resistance N-terminal domain-containing protein n=1 Tax=Miscanthus lutarioriparius TaxID=422564 RepID=A0A811QMX0_9POAL|nr:unnamed protein product [Miscanthus lutarioriparius]
MAEVMASAAATSVMGSVIGKLAAMLTEKYKLAKDVERGIRFLQEELSSMDAILQMLAEMDDDQIDARAKYSRSKVRGSLRSGPSSPSSSGVAFKSRAMASEWFGGVVGSEAVALVAQKLNMAPEWLFEFVYVASLNFWR